MSKFFVSLFLFVSLNSVSARTDLFFNSFGPLGGRYVIGVEHAISPKIGAVLSARYIDQGQGILSAIFYPVNIDKMYNLSGSIGVNYYPFSESRGFYGSVEVDGGYHSTKMNERHTPMWGLDSMKVDGVFLSPGAKLGYKWVFWNRFALAPEIGVSYTMNTTDFYRISQLPSADEEESFFFSRRQLKEHNTGIHPIIILQTGYRF